MNDGLILAGLLAATGLTLAHFDFFELLYDFTRAHEEWELDEIICALLVAPVFFAVFAYNRLVDLTRSVAALRETKAELEHSRAHLQDEIRAATRELRGKSADLEIALERQKELNALQREFMAMASHELRGPLAVVDGTAQRIARQAGRGSLEPTGAIERVAKIRHAVARMTRLMEQTLTAVRDDADAIRLDIAPCDIAGVIAQVCASQQELAPTHTLHCDVDGLPETMETDRGAIEQILANIIGNAVKYAPDAPDIDVRARSDKAGLTISVRDRGVGIDEQDLPRIGERFFRAGTSTGIKGTGIGINVSKRLLDQLGGRLEIDSRKGEGSTVTIHLPLAVPRSAEDEQVA